MEVRRPPVLYLAEVRSHIAGVLQPSRPASTAVSQLFETRSSNNNNNWRGLKLLAQLPTGNQRTQKQAAGFKSHFLSTEQSRKQRFLEDFRDVGEKRNFPADCSHKADMSRDLSSSFLAISLRNNNNKKAVGPTFVYRCHLLLR